MNSPETAGRGPADGGRWSLDAPGRAGPDDRAWGRVLAELGSGTDGLSEAARRLAAVRPNVVRSTRMVAATVAGTAGLRFVADGSALRVGNLVAIGVSVLSAPTAR